MASTVSCAWKLRRLLSRSRFTHDSVVAAVFLQYAAPVVPPYSSLRPAL